MSMAHAASPPWPCLTRCVCRRPDTYNKFLTAQHSAVCSWEEYSAWKKKEEKRKGKQSSKSAAASAAAWRVPWQPTTIKELNRHGDMDKIRRKMEKIKEKIKEKTKENQQELQMLKRRHRDNLLQHQEALKKLNFFKAEYEAGAVFYAHFVALAEGVRKFIADNFSKSEVQQIKESLASEGEFPQTTRLCYRGMLPGDTTMDEYCAVAQLYDKMAMIDDILNDHLSARQDHEQLQ